MEKMFYPKSIVIIGLSSKPNNIPRLILGNLLRWGYMGRILGVNPRVTENSNVDGVKMFKRIEDLPLVPDLAVALIPAKYIPDTIKSCGIFGIHNMAIPSGGFNEFGPEGKKIAQKTVENARKYGVNFVGPNGVTIANTANGLCLPFVPSYPPVKGGISIITQSGGVGLMLWNLMNNEDIGMAKFASIGNKLCLDEVDFLEYFGSDRDTKVICIYLESISRGQKLLEVAQKIDKPIIVLKANTTPAGKKAAMSHTAAMHNNDQIVDSAFERAGIIRIHSFSDFISVAKAFHLPPMKGNRLMVMSPAGGFTVMMAELCEQLDFEFADPRDDLFKGLSNYSNAGVIKFSNPLDMGDIYDPNLYAHIFYSVMHNQNVDGAVYVSQWPQMPKGENVFYKMFNTDLSNETIGAIQSSGKPLGVCLFGLATTTYKIKQNISLPIFNSPEEMLFALKVQGAFFRQKEEGKKTYPLPTNIDLVSANSWLEDKDGEHGEECLDLLESFGLPAPQREIVVNQDEAENVARNLGMPVVLKVISKDALHKSDAGGVLLNLDNEQEVRAGFEKIRANLFTYNQSADFQGVRVMEQAKEGFDMFIGGSCDPAFGQVMFFGFGGIYVEAFDDIANVLCPATHQEVADKLQRLKSFKILQGARGKKQGDIQAYIDAVVRVSHLLYRFPQIVELDINPIRVFPVSRGILALDARMKITT